MVTSLLQCPPENPIGQLVKRRTQSALKQVNDRVKSNTWLAGEEFTAADVMVGFSLTTGRLFSSMDLSPYEGILEYLKRVGQRPAYQRAMEKGDPGLEPILGGPPPKNMLTGQ